jgi:hypothetical protein
MSLFLSILSSGATAIAAFAAVASWRSANAANQTTNSLVELERHRRHEELTPIFKITSTKLNMEVIHLSVQLVGPPGLDRLDRLTLSIRNDSRFNLPPNTYVQDELMRNQIWGPYRFSLGIDNATSDGRGNSCESLFLGDSWLFQLERTQTPPWTDSAWWGSQFSKLPIKLTLVGERNGDDPWIVPFEDFH